jgi:hypothetical protein
VLAFVDSMNRCPGAPAARPNDIVSRHPNWVEG